MFFPSKFMHSCIVLECHVFKWHSLHMYFNTKKLWLCYAGSHVVKVHKHTYGTFIHTTPYNAGAERKTAIVWMDNQSCGSYGIFKTTLHKCLNRPLFLALSQLLHTDYFMTTLSCTAVASIKCHCLYTCIYTHTACLGHFPVWQDFRSTSGLPLCVKVHSRLGHFRLWPDHTCATAMVVW